MTSNIDSIVANWVKRAKSLEGAMVKATLEATKTVFAESKKKLTQEIYDKPIPAKGDLQEERMGGEQARGRITGIGAKGSRYGRYAGGTTRYKDYGKAKSKPAWKRTGNLRRMELMKIISPYEGMIYNDASRASEAGSRGYAKPRHDAGWPGKRKVRYVAHWRHDAVEISRPKVRIIYRNAMISVIRAGIVPGIGGLK